MTHHVDLMINRFMCDGETIDDEAAIEIAARWQAPNGYGKPFAEFASQLIGGTWTMPDGMRDSIADALRRLPAMAKAAPGAYTSGDLGSVEFNRACLLALTDYLDVCEAMGEGL